MVKRLTVVLAVGCFCLGAAASGFAGDTKTLDVRAYVPVVSGGLSVTVSKQVPTGGTPIESGASVPIDFGTLQFDSTYKVFRPQYIYFVDIGVNDNTGNAWTITHGANSVRKDATNNLDNNINVSFVKQLTATTDQALQKVVYSASNNIAYSKTQLSGGWLRIYYGIAAGQNDATGALPIGADKPAGQYAGSVVITLAP